MKPISDAIQESIYRTFIRLPASIARDTIIIIANRLESADSPLCDCQRLPGAHITHDCDCAAVHAARYALDGLTHTLHAQQCHGCRP